MLQVIHEQSIAWPKSGPVDVSIPAVAVTVPVSPVVARRYANNYLGNHVGMSFLANNPILVMGDSPCWRFDVDLQLPSFGKVATLGELDVNASSGTVTPLSDEEIDKIQNLADAIASSLIPEPA